MLTYHLYTLSKPVIPNVFSSHIRDMWDAKVMLPQPISKFLLKNLLVTTRNNGKGHIGDSVAFGATNWWQSAEVHYSLLFQNHKL